MFVRENDFFVCVSMFVNQYIDVVNMLEIVKMFGIRYICCILFIVGVWFNKGYCQVNLYELNVFIDILGRVNCMFINL